MPIKVTIRKRTTGIMLHVSNNEHLVYRVKTIGPPMFTLVNSDPQKLLLSHQDKGVSGSTGSGITIYERQWPKPSDSVELDSMHTLSMLFLSPIKYTFQVELYRDGTLQTTLVDEDFESLNKEDWTTEPLHILSL